MMMRKLSLIFLASIFLPAYLFAACDPLFETSFSTHGDTVCAGVQIDFNNTSNVSGGIVSTQWNFGDGSQDLFTEDASHTYIQSGTYTVIYLISSANCTGLQVQHTIYVIDPPMGLAFGTNASCFGVCDGEATLDIQIAPHANYDILWDDPDNQPQQLLPGFVQIIMR